jgi:hypothetical protein
MATDESNFDTLMTFYDLLPYGEVLTTWAKLWIWADDWGKADPLDRAVTKWVTP